MAIVAETLTRYNARKYFDKAYEGEPVIVPRKNGKNVVIISEKDYWELERLRKNAEKLAMLRESSEQVREGRTVETTPALPKDSE
ncbi:MAG: type II toxin-antitoxin system Phd/YefM family antitoxin [Erysipelotrichaceae bacterium]|nr:type II toxin-antitoxin system Phd/YefM family antitoxin [Erysipelotrichaceae bacterium]